MARIGYLKASKCPTAPNVTAAIAGDSQVTLSFATPARLGSSAVIRYEAIDDYDGHIYNLGLTLSGVVITTLANNVPHRFRVAAVNSQGRGAWSPLTAPLTPAAVGGMIVLNAALPRAKAGRLYTTTLMTVGGGANKTYSGGGTYISLGADGRLVGFIPTGVSSDTVSGTVTDGTSTISFSFVINVISVSGSLNVSGIPATINATQNGAFHLNLAAYVTGGSGRYAFTINSATGASSFITSPSLEWLQSTTLPSTGNNVLSMTCTDDAGNTATFTITVTVDTTLRMYGVDAGSLTANMPQAMSGSKYAHTFLGNGGSNSGIAAVVSGSVPGLTFSGMGVTGTPTTPGSYPLSVYLTDSASHTSVTYTYTLMVLADMGATRPSWNTGTGFFVLNGRLYDPNGRPFQISGVNVCHYDSQWLTYIGKTNANAARIFYATSGTGPTPSNMASEMTSAIAADVFPIACMATLQPYAITFTATPASGATSATLNANFPFMTGTYYLYWTRADNSQQVITTATCTLNSPTVNFSGGLPAAASSANWTVDYNGNTSGSNSLFGFGRIMNFLCASATTTAIQSILNANGAINVANEFFNGTSDTQWRDIHAQVSGTISGISGTTLTISDTVNPFSANAIALQYLYIKGAGGVTNGMVRIVSSGGSAGAWTFTLATAITGYTSGGTIYGGAIGYLRAAGYTCPLQIDTDNYAQEDGALFSYGATVVNSDPLKNIILSYHLYGFTPNLECPIATVATGGTNTTLGFNIPSVFVPNNGASNPFRGNIYYDGAGAYVTGVAGMTQLNGTTGAVASTSGTTGPYSLAYATASSGFTGSASGGYVYSSNDYRIRIAKLAAMQAQGIMIMIGEFGPANPPLTTNNPSPTWTQAGQVIRACQNAGLGFLYWALDDGYGGGNNTTNGDFALCGLASAGATDKAMYRTPADLTSEGGNTLLHPMHGLIAVAQPASCYL